TQMRKSVYKTEFVASKHEELNEQTDDHAVAGIPSEEQEKLIDRAMAKIPNSEAVVLTLFYLEENSIKEVAEIMGLTTSNVKVKLHRGRKNLAEAIKKEDG